MTDFDYDCAQKKRIAKSAHNHVNARRGKCKLPHEYLTRKELNALNGEVKNYDLGKPMDLDTFRDMPDDLKKQYIEDLQERFHANDYLLAEMLGCSRQSVLYHRKLLGIKGLPRGSTPGEEQLKAWKTWMGENEEQMDPPVAETPRKEEETPIKILAYEMAPQVAAQLSFSIAWANVHSWEELYALAKQFPFPDKPAIVTVEVR